MLETHEIRYFVVLARELHFSRAAEKCNVSQPALTRAIRKLEGKLGGLLFDRRPNQIELTELGRKILPRLQSAMIEITGAEIDATALKNQRMSRLRLGVMCTAGPSMIAPLLRLFLERTHDVELQVIEARAGTVVDLLMADEIDIGIAAWTQYPEAIERLPCYRERYAIAMPEDHLLGKLDRVPLHQLSGEDYLERLACEFDEHFAAQIGEWTIDLNVRFASEREDWIQSMIAAGQGVTIVPEYSDSGPGVVVRPLIEPEISREVALLTVRGRKRGRAAGEFIRLVQAHGWGRKSPTP